MNSAFTTNVQPSMCWLSLSLIMFAALCLIRDCSGASTPPIIEDISDRGTDDTTRTTRLSASLIFGSDTTIFGPERPKRRKHDKQLIKLRPALHQCFPLLYQDYACTGNVQCSIICT